MVFFVELSLAFFDELKWLKSMGSNKSSKRQPFLPNRTIQKVTQIGILKVAQEKDDVRSPLPMRFLKT